MRSTIYLFSVLSIALSGCTTSLTNEKLQFGTQPKAPGFSYFLPKQRFSVTAVYEIKSCPDFAGAFDAPTRPLIVTQTASIVETPVADADEYYSIPLNTLTSGWKTTSLTGTLYENQTLHTIGATVDDRSGSVVKGVLGTALSVARIVVGIPANAAAPKLCKSEVYDALDVIANSKSKLIDPSLDEKARASWTAAVTTARASLQITETYVFSPDAKNVSVTKTPEASKISRWFENSQLISNASAEDRARFTDTLTTDIAVEGQPTSVLPATEALKGLGVVYREPAPITVRVCAKSCADKKADELARLETQAAQFGRHVVIPLKNRPFEKNNLSLSFAANGRLESFTYGTESRFEKMATTLSESATSIEGFAAKKKAADDAATQAAAGAELKVIKAETEMLNSKADKIEALERLTKLAGPQ